MADIAATADGRYAAKLARSAHLATVIDLGEVRSAKVTVDEAIHRAEKAIILAQILHDAGATADEVGRLDEAGWDAACRIAGFHPSYSPSDVTRATVTVLLRHGHRFLTGAGA